MDEFLRNRTFDELQPGDTASIVRLVGRDDIDLFAAISGDQNRRISTPPSRKPASSAMSSPMACGRRPSSRPCSARGCRGRVRSISARTCSSASPSPAAPQGRFRNDDPGNDAQPMHGNGCRKPRGEIGLRGKRHPLCRPDFLRAFGNRLYAFSMPGKKLDILHANPRACLLIESFESKQHWKSVVIDVAFRELPDTNEFHDERLKAWSLLAEDFDWWEPGALKLQPQATVAASPHVFFEFEIVEISGREASAETG